MPESGAALATENVVRFETVGKPEASALAGVIRQLSLARSLDEVMAVVSRGVRALLQADGASFVLRDADRCYYAEEDAVSPLWKGRRFPMSACISGWCMTHRQSVAVPDIYQDHRIPAGAYRPTFVRSLAVAPVGRDEPVAALGAYWAEMRQPRPEELQQLQAIADAAALAMTKFLQPLQAGSSSRRGPDANPPAPKPPEQETAPAGPKRGSPRAFIARLRRGELRPNSLEAYAFAVLCVLAATLAREVFKASGARGLAVFSTYYPAVLLAMLMGGRRAGLLAAALGGLAAHYFFMPPLHHFVTLTASDALNFTLYGGASALIILIIDWYQRAVLRLRHEDAKHLTLAREQSHRLKNAVAVVEAVVKQSLRDQPDRGRTITRRIRAGLAQVDLLDEGADQPSTLRQLLTAELEPYDLGRFTLDGEDGPLLPPKTRIILSLVIHELATNALKHGALSAPHGQVTLAWGRREGRTKIVWLEAGGPSVQPPQKRGYGSVLLQRLVQAAGGALAVDFRPGGVRAEISFALA